MIPNRSISLTFGLAFMGLASALPAQAAGSKSRHAAHDAAPKATSSEARHKDCLAFIERHGLSCDPWKQPTCGYDLGIARPLSCVAP
jgi:hypothetical protein